MPYVARTDEVEASAPIPSKFSVALENCDTERSGNQEAGMKSGCFGLLQAMKTYCQRHEKHQCVMVASHVRSGSRTAKNDSTSALTCSLYAPSQTLSTFPALEITIVSGVELNL